MAETAVGFDQLIERARRTGPQKLVVAGAHERNVLMAVHQACEDGIAEPILIGDRPAIERIAGAEGIDLEPYTVQHTTSERETALAAVQWVERGRVGALMKGTLSTPALMHVILNHGLRTEGRLLSHIAVHEHPRLGRLVLASDCGIVPYPTLEQRVQIIQNAVEAMRAIGVAEPRVALMSSSEEIDDKIPCSLDAVKLKEMARPGGPLHGYGQIDGPFDFFSAVDEEAAEIKGLGGLVAGRADILHSPDVVAGNLMSKAMMYFAGGIRAGGCVVGGTLPIVLLSRASPAPDKYNSILLGLICSGR